MNKNQISELGMVGCGGAGFPTHVKLAATGIDHLIVNGAECEPLLHKDKEIPHHRTEEFFSGLKKAVDLTGAKKAHVAVKKKYSDLVSHLEKSVPDSRISILRLGDFYPSGDEYELVYEASSRLIPFGGIPLNIGCVVINVETLTNLGREKPVVTKFLTIAGAVPNAITVEVPVGISYREALQLSGLSDFSGLVVIDGGPMMGKIVNSYDEVITKTCGGLIALPQDHNLIKRMLRSDKTVMRIARSACDQCTDCTELCPRRLLGYPIQPHKAMRTAQLVKFNENSYSLDSVFCCECGLCTLFSCPEDLPPREVTVLAKKHHLGKGVKLTDWRGSPTIHPMRSSRRVSITSLLKRLGLKQYDKPAPLTPVSIRPERVRLPLKMNLGMAAVPIVKTGERVSVGQKIGAIPEGKLGAVLHASISGKVESVTSGFITIVKGIRGDSMDISHNAIGVIELSSIAMGYQVTDAMLKAASVELVLSRTVRPGKFTVLVWGDVAAVEASVGAGLMAGEGFLVNDLVIPNLHDQVFPAITATNQVSNPGALGVVETFDIVSTILAADASVKAAEVTLCEVRIAMAIGGKAFYSVTGDVSAVEAAVDAGKAVLEGKGQIVYSVVIPRPREELFREFI